MEFSQQELDAVREAARGHALDRYLAALLAPARHRADLISLAAFVGEIERIPLIVTDPALGEIRFRWWLDWLEEQRGEVRQAATRSGNPIADVFGDVIVRKQLPIDDLKSLVDARAFELYAVPFDDVAAFEDFLSATSGASFKMAARILADGAVIDSRAQEAIGNYGRAYGAGIQLMRLPLLATRGRWGLYGDGEMIDATALGDVKVRARADKLREEGVALAEEGLAAIRSSDPCIPDGLKAAILPAALTGPYLKALERQRDWLRDGAQITPLSRVWRLWWAKAVGKF